MLNSNLSFKPFAKAAKALLILSLPFCVGTASAQSSEKEPAAIFELGAATSWNVHGGRPSFGPTVAVEVTPIKNWLELEAGVTPLFARHSTEWETDLLFKKPWDISRRFEFMLGVGPAWVHTSKAGERQNSISGEIAPDLMFWPSPRHRLGWYIEPSYEYNFARVHEQSITVTVGILFGIG